MRCVVTGAAGFIGSHLCESLVELGHDVKGIDAFTDYYSRRIKMSNVRRLMKSRSFALEKTDLSRRKIDHLLKRVDVVFHLAAQPGVRLSWGSHFSAYVRDNVVATQRLLESAANSNLSKFVFASSSSIYGDAESMPTPEEVTPAPVSPYGATKVLGEHLCHSYFKNRNLPVVRLRYFTVYGPRQRPDMAFNRFIRAISEGKPIAVFGDGSQLRDFTFVSDAVRATILASEARGGSLFNVGGGVPHRLSEAIDEVGTILRRKPKVHQMQPAPGDVRGTSADITKIRRLLGWEPTVKLRQGLEDQIEWQLRDHLKK